ncbi:short chain dehydrogenase family protein, putative [Talaromyces stipitatus ATCC 10500]|uniref:Short chain dehydrogenase family protein, putative n=1 Tax=Talaromyces stipitatus (strain ATCC 10500 / CBS 375.48 / QM 6759 / NRRL 1006) TaxID=441959 RepID=B8M5J2_TALSN|nr:short chain dehydrogenase family protein, putative [Talaromyces stipitatus ATCC 10500]EED19886.1 short chain dehydrogenase family protein, putative [Talaromyces stipitatus ATCC 10500]
MDPRLDSENLRMPKTIALISGANQGIGLATATRLAREHGYQVIIGSRNANNGLKAAKELQSEGLSVDSVQLDITSDESIAKAAEYITQKYSRLDVLINNAGIQLDVRVQGEAANMSLRQLWELTLSTNVIGTACLTEAMIPLLRKSSQRPRVIFVSTRMASLAESLNPNTLYYKIDYKMYDTSKVGVNMLVSNYARILGEEMRARVNAVCPGLIQTQLTGYIPYGEKPEAGAQRIVELATVPDDDETTGTFSDRHGVIPW